nr:SGNH hydrolase-type esterase domain-containing protein [Tanacetum cinerariifolium]
MSTSSAVTYTSISFEARSWSIPTEDPYEEADQYLEYLDPSDDDIPMEDQPLPTDASPIDLSSGYSFDDDDVEEDEEEEEHLAPADSTAFASPAVDHVPSVEETELSETNESAATPPPPPAYRVTAKMSIRSQAPIPFPSEEEVATLLALPTPPSSPLTIITTSPDTITTHKSYLCSSTARAAMAQMRAATPPTYHLLLSAGTPPLLPIPLPAPSTSHRADILKADMSPRKGLLLTAPTPRYEVGESYAAGAARQSGFTVALRVDYSFMDTVKTSVRAMKRKAMTAIEHQEACEDYATVRAEIGVLRRERLAHEQEISETRQALVRSEAHNGALEARIATVETQLYHMEWQRQDADDRATEHIMCTHALEARARIDTLKDIATTTTTTMTMTDAQLKALIDRGVGAALLECDTDRSKNGEDSYDSGSGGRRLAPTAPTNSHEAENDMGYDPSDVAFIEWLGSKFFNYKTMDHHTMKALWIYWIRGDDEVELTNDDISDNEDEVAEVFRIDTNIFDFETPMCKTFKEFNYLLQINPDLLTKDIEGFKLMKNIRMIGSMNGTKMYHGLTRNHGLIGVWTKPKPLTRYCKPFNYKTRCSEWPACSWKNDGYHNGGNLLGAYILGNKLHYQDYEWYDALIDCELKEQALQDNLYKIKL